MPKKKVSMEKCPLSGNPVENYLLHSYIYYELFDSKITDAEFDALCAWMLENYDTLEHEHKDLVTKDALKAGTGHHLVRKFPEDIQEMGQKMIHGYVQQKHNLTTTETIENR